MLRTVLQQYRSLVEASAELRRASRALPMFCQIVEHDMHFGGAGGKEEHYVPVLQEARIVIREPLIWLSTKNIRGLNCFPWLCLAQALGRSPVRNIFEPALATAAQRKAALADPVKFWSSNEQAKSCKRNLIQRVKKRNMSTSAASAPDAVATGLRRLGISTANAVNINFPRNMVVGKAILRLLQLPGGFEAADLQTVFKDNGVKAPGQIREFIQLAKLFSSPSNDAVFDSVALKYCGGFVGASLGAVMISHSITGTAPDSLSSAISTIVQAMKGSAAEAAIQWLSENSVDLFGLQIKRYQFTAAEVVREICENRQICNIAAKLDGEWNFWFRKVLLMSAGRVYFPEPMATESLVPIILEEDFEATKTVAPTAKTLGGPDGKLSDGLLRMTAAIDDLSGSIEPPVLV